MHTKHPLYQTWMNMKSRCYNPNNPAFASYGGRGIRVCDRWLQSFWAFVEDVGERPVDHTLDRYPNRDGNYGPDNFRWASHKQQQRNMRTTVFVEIEGVEHAIRDLAEGSRWKPATIVARANKGLSLAEVLSDERQPYHRPDAKTRFAAWTEKRRNMTHCKRGHALTPENVLVFNGCRSCKECRKITRQQRAAKALSPD